METPPSTFARVPSPPALAALAALAACAHAGAGTGGAGAGADDPVRDTIAGVAHQIDAKRWDDLRRLYADEVETDYTSLFGGSPQRQSGDALIAGWKGALASVATHHLLGPIVVRRQGDRASAECHVRGLHRAAGAPGGELWEVLGHYLFELGRRGDGAWKITKMTLVTQIQTGNTRLLEEANRPR